MFQVIAYSRKNQRCFLYDYFCLFVMEASLQAQKSPHNYSWPVLALIAKSLITFKQWQNHYICRNSIILKFNLIEQRRGEKNETFVFNVLLKRSRSSFFLAAPIAFATIRTALLFFIFYCAYRNTTHARIYCRHTFARVGQVRLCFFSLSFSLKKNSLSEPACLALGYPKLLLFL